MCLVVSKQNFSTIIAVVLVHPVGLCGTLANRDWISAMPVGRQVKRGETWKDLPLMQIVWAFLTGGD